MCGITGFIAVDETRRPQDEEIISLERMTDALAHRGPDDRGVWRASNNPVYFGHRRLSVLDLSPAGHQPMISDNGRYTLVFNGEIYNHQKLREELQEAGDAPDWRGSSDTETLLMLIEARGLPAALELITGMFAFALWDNREGRLYLARDRFGEKPLYYGRQGNYFYFSSELKALKQHPDFVADIDRNSLVMFLRHGYVPAPYSIYQGISKLLPGTFLCMDLHSGELTTHQYWSYKDISERQQNRFTGSEEEAIEQLDNTLGHAVNSQLISDVPLGALLSGGIDSSLICALMQAHSTRPISTYTIGFNEPEYNEAEHAKQVAMHLQTNHHELYLNASDVTELIPNIPELWDEPFADSSQIPTFLVMKMARSGVSVALSGDGGDELFGGYNRYLLAPKAWNSFSKIPRLARKAVGQAMLMTDPGKYGSMVSVLPGSSLTHFGTRLSKLGLRLARVNDIDELYLSLLTEWPDAEKMVCNGNSPDYLLMSPSRWPDLQDPVQRMMATDALTYLPDDILVKVDRAAMAVSLETRAPFLDRQVAEFACSLPMHMKIKNGVTKSIPRQLLYKYVPKELVERPKMGFGIPLDIWLRGPLSGWVEELLSEDRLDNEGYFDTKKIRSIWQAHKRGASYGYRLWSILMFQSWLASQQRV